MVTRITTSRADQDRFTASRAGKSTAASRARGSIDRMKDAFGQVQMGGGIDFLSSSGSGGGGGSGNVGGGGGGGGVQPMSFEQQAIEELRRQFDLSRADIAPFMEAGVGQLPALIQGTTAGGLDERLAGIFGTDAFSSLRDERTRSLEGQLAAGGLTRSGTALEEAAAIPADLGLMLEQLLTGRSANLAGMGQESAFGQAELGAQTSRGIADIFQQQGQDRMSGIIADKQASAASTSNLVNIAATAAGIFFSDPALKQNIEPISHIADLTLYEWDWIPEASGTMIEKCGTTGFMADEVKDKYPQHVGEFGGFMVIDYPALLDELEAGPCQQ